MGKKNEVKKQSIPEQQTLPSKQSSLFKQRFYEEKMYKKGLKNAEQILKKFPQNGETLVMKGLLLNSVEKREEGETCIRAGLRYNIKSHICWHVFGLFHKSDRNYKESIKCYLNALRIDPGNLQILKDLAYLQIQMRNLEGFCESRRQILVSKPNNRLNWITYAISNYLLGNLEATLSILDSYQRSVGEEETEYDTSELILFKNLVIEKLSGSSEALVHLENFEDSILDIDYVLEKRANLSVSKTDAFSYYKSLLDRNENNGEYISGLLHNSESSEKETLLELVNQYPKSHQLKKVMLAKSSGDEFMIMVEEYLKTGLRKGIPSLFLDLKTLYSDSKKHSVIESIILEFLSEMKSNPSLEYPSVYLWTLFYYAHHLDYFNKHQEALDILSEASTHSPTCIDIHLLRASIYKHAGDAFSAFEACNKARELDLADRYLNCETTKYAFECGNIEEGSRISGLFLKDGNYTISMFEMQASWFELAQGKCLRDCGYYGGALKKLSAIQMHFDDMIEDQFDFHIYSIRKTTLRSYLKMLEWADSLRSHPYFREATIEIVKTYLQLNDLQISGIDVISVNKNENIKKKDKNSQRRTQAGLKYENEDVYGLSFLKVDDFLLEASKNADLLVEYCFDDFESLILACNVYMKRGKLLRALKVLQKCRKTIIDFENHNKYSKFKSQLFQLEVQYTVLVSELSQDEVNATVFEILQSTVKPVEDIYNSMKDKLHTTYDILSLAKTALIRKKPSLLDESVKLILDSWNYEQVQLSVSIELYEVLKEFNDVSALNIYLQVARERFIYSTYFQNMGN